MATAGAVHGPVYGQWATLNHNDATLLRFEACLAREQQEVEEQKESRGQVKPWRTRQGVLQVKVASEASPIAVEC